jgi:hypothetical protein
MVARKDAHLTFYLCILRKREEGAYHALRNNLLTNTVLTHPPGDAVEILGFFPRGSG